jgi:hypothetical protein
LKIATSNLQPGSDQWLNAASIANDFKSLRLETRFGEIRISTVM